MSSQKIPEKLLLLCSMYSDSSLLEGLKVRNIQNTLTTFSKAADVCNKQKFTHLNHKNKEVPLSPWSANHDLVKIQLRMVGPNPNVSRTQKHTHVPF